MVLKILLIFYFIGMYQLQAQVLGERQSTDFDGATHEIVLFDKENKPIFEEVWRKNQYSTLHTSSEVMSWKDHLLSFEKALFCPDEQLRQDEGKIEFLVQSFKLSLLRESLVLQKRQLMAIGSSEAQACDVNWEQKCQMGDPAIRRFLLEQLKNLPRDDYFLPKDFSYKKEKSQWINEFSRTHPTRYLSAKFWQDKPQSTREFEVSLVNGCKNDHLLIQKVCEKNDLLFGLSTQPVFIHFLKSTDWYGHYFPLSQHRCLERWTELKSFQEFKNHDWNITLPFLFSELKNFQRPVTGQFMTSSIRPFDFYVTPTPTSKDSQAPTQTTRIEKASTPVVESVPVKALAPVIVGKNKPLPQVEIKPQDKEAKVSQPEVSANYKKIFKATFDHLIQSQLRTANLDMVAFKYDYVLTPEQLALVQEDLKQYSSQKALQEMKASEGFGSYRSPVPLSFLKALIDLKAFTSIYNLLSVLGQKFWIENDFDPPQDKVYIELKVNDETQGVEITLYSTTEPAPL